MGIQYAKETEGWSGWHIECPLFATVTPKQDDIDKVKAMAVEYVRFGVKRVLEDLEAA
jgi:hypothetical protein